MCSLWIHRLAIQLGLITSSVVLVGVSSAAMPANQAPQPVPQVQSNQDGFVATLNGERLRVTVCSDSVIHVVAATAIKKCTEHLPLNRGC